MSNLQLEQIRTALLSRGYSRSYVTGLVDELYDHVECSISEAESSGKLDAGDLHQRTLQRLGSLEAIVNSVAGQSDLLPLPKRSPCLAFVIIPGLILAVAVLSMLGIAQLMTSAEIALPYTWKRVVEGGFEWTTALASVAMVFAVFAVAGRFRVNPVFPCMAAAMVSLVGWYDMDFFTCEVTNRTLCVAEWGYNGWRTLAPMAAVVLAGCCMTSWAQRWFSNLGRRIPFGSSHNEELVGSN